jgi:hypothetical protein
MLVPNLAAVPPICVCTLYARAPYLPMKGPDSFDNPWNNYVPTHTPTCIEMALTAATCTQIYTCSICMCTPVP